MAKWKKSKPGVKDGAEEARANSRLRRHYKEKARRERLIRSRPPKFKDRFVQGCFAVGIATIIVVIVALTWSCVKLKWLE